MQSGFFARPSDKSLLPIPNTPKTVSLTLSWRLKDLVELRNHRLGDPARPNARAGIRSDGSLCGAEFSPPSKTASGWRKKSKSVNHNPEYRSLDSSTYIPKSAFQTRLVCVACIRSMGLRRFRTRAVGGGSCSVWTVKSAASIRQLPLSGPRFDRWSLSVIGIYRQLTGCRLVCPRRFEVCCAPPSYRAENETQMCPIPQKPASVVLLLRLSPIAFSYYGSRFVQAILCSF